MANVFRLHRLNQSVSQGSLSTPSCGPVSRRCFGIRLLSLMDVCSGYNQIHMRPEDVEKSTFMTDRQVKLVLQSNVFRPQKHKGHLLAFKGRTICKLTDDKMVKSMTKLDHITNLDSTLELLQKRNLKLNAEKCSFGMHCRKFLGSMLISRGQRLSRKSASWQSTYQPLLYEQGANISRSNYGASSVSVEVGRQELPLLPASMNEKHLQLERRTHGSLQSTKRIPHQPASLIYMYVKNLQSSIQRSRRTLVVQCYCKKRRGRNDPFTSSAAH